MAKDQEREKVHDATYLQCLPVQQTQLGEWRLTAFNPGTTTLVQDRGENISGERRHPDEKSTSALVRLLHYSWSETTLVPPSELHEASRTMQPLEIIVFYTTD